MTADGTIVGGGRFATDHDGHAEIRRYVGQWLERFWAIKVV